MTLTVTLDVTLAGAPNSYLDGSYAVTVSDNVLDTNGDELKPFSTILTYEDETQPTVTAVKYKAATGKIEVDFSEPLKVQPGVVRQDGTPVTADTFAVGDDSITFDNDADEGTSSEVYVALGEDFAGNVQTAYTGSVSVPSDTTALEVASLTQTGSNQVTIKFNKALAGADATATETALNGALKILVGSAVYTDADATASIVSDRDSDDTTKFVVSFDLDTVATDANYGFYSDSTTSKSVTFMLDEEALEDVYGNLNDAYSQTITMTKDQSGPVLVSAKLAPTKDKFLVTFSEKLGTVTDSKVYVRESGVDTGAEVNVISTDDAKVLEVTPNAAYLDAADGNKVIAGTYTIRFDKGGVKDLFQVDAAAVTTSAVVVDESAAKLVAAITDGTNKNEFQVAFTKDGGAQEVTDSALNLNNYRIDGAVLPSGTDIYFTDGDKDTVYIKLPSSSINYGDATTGTSAMLTVINVKDTEGTTVTTKSDAVTVADNTKATLASVALNGNMLTFTFNENLDDSAYTLANLLGDFEIKGGVNVFDLAGATPADAVVTVDGKKLYVTITGNDSNWSTVKAANTITVKSLQAGTTGAVTTLTDANGVKVKSGVSVTVSK